MELNDMKPGNWYYNDDHEEYFRISKMMNSGAGFEVDYYVTRHGELKRSCSITNSDWWTESVPSSRDEARMQVLLVNLDDFDESIPKDKTYELWT